MDKNAWWKWLLLVLALVGSALLVTPLQEKVRLGLDIQGGYSFTLQLDEEALRDMLRERHPELTERDFEDRVAAAIRNADEVAVEIIRNRIDPLGLEEPVITRGREDRRIYVQLPGATEEKRELAERSVRSVAFLEFRLVHANNQQLASSLLAQGRAPEGYRVVSVADRSYYRRTEDFHRVVDDPAAYARSLSRFEIPDPAYSFMLEQVQVNQETLYRPIFVRRRPEMTGENLRNAALAFDNFGQPTVRLEFNMQGARDFDRVTGRYAPDGELNRGNRVGRQLAVVLDGTVYSAPEIKSRIPDGIAIISGAFDQAEANFLRTILNASALPAPLKFMGQRFVSPTLGEDAIAGAIQAILWGATGVVLFMLLFYRAFGLVANIAFLLDLLLLPVGAVIAAGVFGVLVPETAQAGRHMLRLPVLTLPGIAGILLTLGMAVDANVLIFERVREEQRAGKRLYDSIMTGYQRAFLAIVDSNVTTIITAVILFIFGSGLIRGFAVMLTAGILVSLFTVLVITKLIFRTVVPEASPRRASMMQLLPADRTIDFIGRRKPMIVGALVIILVTLGSSVVSGWRNPASVFAVDFTGGAKIAYTVKDRDAATVDRVREVAAAVGISDAAPQYQEDERLTYLEIKTVHAEIDGADVAAVLTRALLDEIPEAGFEYLDVDSVGSQVGSEMKRSALLAIVLSLVGMIAYITLRFEFGFAVGAIAALVHDVLITVGIFLFLGNQISLTIVAAVLTIVGYSVNDTIVIFDRIREELKRDQRSDFKELCNRCINMTLSRTLLTSLTTMLSVTALLVFGRGDIRAFALTMLIGIVTGVFSTVYIATPAMLAWYKHKRPALGKA